MLILSYGIILSDEINSTANDFRELSAAYFSKDSQTKLRLLRNCGFAKYGRKFESEDLQRYFSSMKWYSVNPKYNDSLLNTYDNAFVKLIACIKKPDPKRCIASDSMIVNRYEGTRVQLDFCRLDSSRVVIIKKLDQKAPWHDGTISKFFAQSYSIKDFELVKCDWTISNSWNKYTIVNDSVLLTEYYGCCGKMAVDALYNIFTGKIYTMFNNGNFAPVYYRCKIYAYIGCFEGYDGDVAEIGLEKPALYLSGLHGVIDSLVFDNYQWDWLELRDLRKQKRSDSIKFVFENKKEINEVYFYSHDDYFGVPFALDGFLVDSLKTGHGLIHR